jgi:hypothetical protein
MEVHHISGKIPKTIDSSFDKSKFKNGDLIEFTDKSGYRTSGVYQIFNGLIINLNDVPDDYGVLNPIENSIDSIGSIDYQFKNAYFHNAYVPIKINIPDYIELKETIKYNTIYFTFENYIISYYFKEWNTKYPIPPSDFDKFTETDISNFYKACFGFSSEDTYIREFPNGVSFIDMQIRYYREFIIQFIDKLKFYKDYFILSEISYENDIKKYHLTEYLSKFVIFNDELYIHNIYLLNNFIKKSSTMDNYAKVKYIDDECGMKKVVNILLKETRKKIIFLYSKNFYSFSRLNTNLVTKLIRFIYKPFSNEKLEKICKVIESED